MAARGARAAARADSAYCRTDGQNIRIDERWAGDERTRLLALANELVELKPELIVACGGPAAAALQGATRSLPIVFVQVVDPVAFGLVASLAHPGGNITGFMHFEQSMVGKWVDDAPVGVNCTAIDRDTVSIAGKYTFDAGLFGSKITAARVMPGTASLSSVLTGFPADDSQTGAWVNSLVQGLRELGWTAMLRRGNANY
jgi:hypothetical protein